MLQVYMGAASGTDSPQDDMTDFLYGLRELLKLYAFQDIKIHSDVFEKADLSADNLTKFDRFIEDTIDTYSGFDVLPSEEIITTLASIGKLGQAYANILADNSGLEDNGRIGRFLKIVSILDTTKKYFVRMSANPSPSIQTEEVSLR
jgi:hypothetical protein